jgi:hypothetical protein
MIPPDGNYCNEDIEMEDRELLQMAAKAYGVDVELRYAIVQAAAQLGLTMP